MPLPPMKWRPGRKVAFYSHGMLLKPRAQERAEKELALKRAELEPNRQASDGWFGE